MRRRRTDDEEARAALARVDARITAAVESAPPLPDDVAARLVELIRYSAGSRSPRAERASA